jgi:hypothetical protein
MMIRIYGGRCFNSISKRISSGVGSLSHILSIHLEISEEAAMVDEAAKRWVGQMEAQASDFMALLADPEWLQRAMEAEEASGGEVGAGYGGRYMAEMMANPAYFDGMKQLQGIVARELRGLLGELNLGAGMEAAFGCARGIVMGRLAKPDVEIQDRLWAVLEDEVRQKPEVRRVLWEVMTEEDWEAIALAASQSMHRHLMERVQGAMVA